VPYFILGVFRSNSSPVVKQYETRWGHSNLPYF
jgi:hypothetical protein